MAKQHNSPDSNAAPRNNSADWAFAGTTFVGAFLLFLVQPLICKYILPWFGGSSSVWTTCMLFFQVTLFGGYAYAHISSRWLKPRTAIIVHLALIALAIVMLPITPHDSSKPDGDGNPTLQILSLLTGSIGLPYFVLSATGPLLQGWRCQVTPATAPFRLYALSSVGSMLALLGFPFYLENHFARSAQAHLWGWGVVVYAIGCVWCGIILWRCSPAATQQGDDIQETQPTQWWQKVYWVLLPACASLLLLATTNKICQEVAVIPLLWVLPLSIYLLSFVICFDNPRWYGRLPFGLALVAALGGACYVLWQGVGVSVAMQVGVYCAVLFVCCMVCHGELYKLRPDARHLTGFYLAIAAGGAIGSLLVAVVAPLIFSGYFELHWGLLLCGLLFLLLIIRGNNRTTGINQKIFPAGFAIALVSCAALLWQQAHRLDDVIVRRTRNFYGVLSVVKYGIDASTKPFLALIHGRTMHGLQFVDPSRANWPTLYYGEESGVGMAIRALANAPRRIGLVGMGVGTLAAYGRPGDYFHIYELDPAVPIVADERFTYLRNCTAKVDVTIGDGRLSLERETPQGFDILALDAFSDDTVPVHLLTREAFEIYQRHLKTNGIIAVHISSASVNLEPVLANVARQLQWRMTVIENESPGKPWIAPSTWALLARNGGMLNSLAFQVAARPPLTNSVNIPEWTDDFAGIFQILHKKPVMDADVDFSVKETANAQQLTGKKDYTGAFSVYRRALEVHPNSPLLLNNLGFLLATCPDVALRDPQKAVELSEFACELTYYRTLNYVSTLAAIYSETGRINQAVAMQEKVCVLEIESGHTPASPLNQKLLELYRTGRPLHEFGPPSHR